MLNSLAAAENRPEAHEGEQISDRRGSRVRGRIRVGYRAHQKGSCEEGDAILACDTSCNQEHRDDRHST